MTRGCKAALVQGPLGTEFVEDDAVQTGPDALLTPSRETPVDGAPGRPERRRQLPPGAARRGADSPSHTVRTVSSTSRATIAGSSFIGT
ncbi:hypothetical protein K378_05342 [Streptomyces sp. Amel2xB2]|nr:hypothetical protein K378_05342 [Streptomyces sp. Amel2xB2]